MAFVYGPRQVGKTTFAKSLGRGPGYLNWDIDADRTRILARDLPKASLWVLDEIHKNRRWRNLLKGLFDGRRPGQRIVITGSARLDLYRFAGDSPQGGTSPSACIPSPSRSSGSESSATWTPPSASGVPEPLYRGEASPPLVARVPGAPGARRAAQRGAIQDLRASALAQRLPSSWALRSRSTTWPRICASPRNGRAVARGPEDCTASIGSRPSARPASKP
jgi:hypothetical protein